MPKFSQHVLRSRRRNRPAPPSLLDVGETVHLSHAIGRLLLSLSPGQVERQVSDLIDLVRQEVDVSAPDTLLENDSCRLRLLRELADQLIHCEAQQTDLDQRLGWLGDILEFDDIDRALLGVFTRHTMFDSWRRLANLAPSNGTNFTAEALGVLSGVSTWEAGHHLIPESRLLQTGLVSDDRDGEYCVSALLKRLVRAPAESRDELERWLMPAIEETSLSWSDFEHLGTLRDLAGKILAAGEPVSILLYGEPGTGKSEFARALAQHNGCGSIFAGLADANGYEPERSERLAHLLMLRTLCKKRNDRFIVVDEADDVLAQGQDRRGSKQWINRLIEDPQVPTIWILNDQASLGDAALRRMTLAIGFERPPLNVRLRIAGRAANANNVALTDAELQSLAALPANPAIVSTGLRAAKLVGGGADVAGQSIKSVMRAMGESGLPARPSSKVYDPAMAAADVDLTDLAIRLAGAPGRGWSLLLSGPSGTGKSAFARHLAERMGIEVLERRGSDLLGAFVGETEGNIAQAFAHAADRGALLLIDEADSFLFRREQGQRTWEVSMVNEMLRQMEYLPAPFVATTNLVKMLDPAVQRRFTLRAQFRPLDDNQVRNLFQAHFGQAWPQREPVSIGQTPGDFAVVAHRATLLGEARGTVLIEWLKQEINARGETVRGPVGFRISEANCLAPVMTKAA